MGEDFKGKYTLQFVNEDGDTFECDCDSITVEQSRDGSTIEFKNPSLRNDRDCSEMVSSDRFVDYVWEPAAHAGWHSILSEMLGCAPQVKEVIFQKPATVVKWDDGDTTVSIATNEEFDREKGLAMCVAKKTLGSFTKFYKLLDEANDRPSVESHRKAKRSRKAKAKRKGKK